MKPEFIDDYEREMLPLIGSTEILDEQPGIMTDKQNMSEFARICNLAGQRHTNMFYC